jgi:transcriptional regulator with XRE-family HTH domain
MIGNEIWQRRKAAKMTAGQLAALLGGCHVNTVWGWEAGRTTPNVTMLCRLAAVFGCTIDALLAEELTGVNCK